jgi:hypothetical protein
MVTMVTHPFNNVGQIALEADGTGSRRQPGRGAGARAAVVAAAAVAGFVRAVERIPQAFAQRLLSPAMYGALETKLNRQALGSRSRACYFVWICPKVAETQHRLSLKQNHEGILVAFGRWCYTWPFRLRPSPPPPPPPGPKKAPVSLAPSTEAFWCGLKSRRY